jgi:dual specificity tyrosine-phosphorylation-regulated kinase 1
VRLIDVYKRVNRNYYDARGSGGGNARGASSSSRSRRGDSSMDPGSFTPPELAGRTRASSEGQRGVYPSERAFGASTDGALLRDRYVLGRVIGRGSFARVIVAYDIVTDTRVAVKVIKRTDAFQAQALKEIEVLRVLGGGGGARGPEGAGEASTRVGHPCVVRMLDAFAHRGANVAAGMDESGGGAEAGADSDAEAGAEQRNTAGFRCLVFELLSHSLYDVLRATRFRGVSLGLTRKFSRQILSALSYLRSHGVVHCDLKPENVLLCSTDRSAVKLIDFGSSCWAGETSDFTYVQSRFYRAAEVILGLPYGCPADVWSLGCIMVELHSGKPLFSGKDEREQLRKITEALGEVPREMVERCPPERRAAHFGAGPGPSSDARPRAPGSNPLRSTIAAAAHEFEARRRKGGEDEREREREREREGEGTEGSADAAAASLRALGLRDGEDDGDGGGGPATKGPSPTLGNLTEVALFCDVVERALTYSPDERVSPAAALEHPFFAGTGEAARAGGREDRGEMDADDEMFMCGLSAAADAR